MKLRLLADRVYGSASALAGVTAAGLMGVLFVFPLLYQASLGASALDAGLSVFPEAVGLMLASQVVDRLLPRLGPRLLTVPALLVAAAVFGRSPSPWGGGERVERARADVPDRAGAGDRGADRADLRVRIDRTGGHGAGDGPVPDRPDPGRRAGDSRCAAVIGGGRCDGDRRPRPAVDGGLGDGGADLAAGALMALRLPREAPQPPPFDDEDAPPPGEGSAADEAPAVKG
ncbi:DHA2 family efflux MFS transporter permease subunit [Streptomyces californicus]